jgi:triosephosphate isomerase
MVFPHVILLLLMQDKLLVANWKSNKNVEEAQQWVSTFLAADKRENRHYVICPPYPLLPFVLDITEHGVDVGVQDISPYGAGAYTGEVSGFNLQMLGVKYAILGHSERRKYLQETSSLVAKKVTQALDFGLTPIVCVDRPEIQAQANALSDEERKRIIVAYEPIHAISTFGGKEDPIDITLQAIADIRDAFGSSTTVLYGGSVDPDSSIIYLAEPSIDGALVGHASLDPNEFVLL